VVLAERPQVASFTFGCPAAEAVARLHERHIGVWVTITDVDEAKQAEEVAADGLVVQGVEVGGHRGSFEDRDGRGELSLLPLLRLFARITELPLVASGGESDGAGVAAALAAGAHAVQIGTGFMRCPEAGTSPVHKDALAQPTGTSLGFWEPVRGSQNAPSGPGARELLGRRDCGWLPDGGGSRGVYPARARLIQLGFAGAKSSSAASLIESS
jgi:Nitronate monooxygenase